MELRIFLNADALMQLIPQTKDDRREAEWGFLLVLYRITFVDQDFPSPRYLDCSAHLPIACISGFAVAAWIPRVPKGT